MACGNIRKELFSLTASHFCQSEKYNTCLYKKIAIDESGAIKNCLLSKQHFGNIDTHSAQEVKELSKHPAFTKDWYNTKRSIKVCCDCEFRNICTDCRQLLKQATDEYSQPLNCRYNPYIAKWEGEAGYTPVS